MPPVAHLGSQSSASPRTAVAIIPARYHSSRLPGKALADIGGMPMIEHVYRRTIEARTIAQVIVATDDQRIMDTVRAFGGEARMTSDAHPSGTDRLAEIAASLCCDLIVNVQGDEPLIDPAMIDAAVSPLLGDAALEMSTLRRRIDGDADLHNPNVTKVVVDEEGFALYFSRAPIPYVREHCPPAAAWQHVGLYVYRRDVLLRLAGLAPTALEQSEALEQLRALAHGIRIRCVETTQQSIGVDTAADLERVRHLVATAAHAMTTAGTPGSPLRSAAHG